MIYIRIYHFSSSHAASCNLLLQEKEAILFYACKNGTFFDSPQSLGLSDQFDAPAYKRIACISWEEQKSYHFVENKPKSYHKCSEKYDVAIAFKLNYENTAITSYLIDAPKKCAFSHTTIEKPYASSFPEKLDHIDHIFCVSEYMRKAFAGLYPNFNAKTSVLHNCIDLEEIKQESMQVVYDDMKRSALLTVGRLSPEKGQQMIPATARLLLNAGYDVTWYLVGDGPTRTEIEQEITKYKVTDHVILLGTKMNPYPYIKNCLIYVQPSFSEGYCTTTMEAKILQKPIVTTDAPGMREQFVSGENGLIVDAMTPEALFEGIKTLLDHPEMRQKFIDNLSKETYDNSSELQKLYDFIES